MKCLLNYTNKVSSNKYYSGSSNEGTPTLQGHFKVKQQNGSPKLPF